ncbi:DUF5107 domain-containing protein [Silvibacterium acidisoli]|uniref:DUF5107 domain-containing protein n=1 Tax=Acidobacteriaceae bacterium ZG23-2 TaxID=2883246 RepID=UPI00406C46F9
MISRLELPDAPAGLEGPVKAWREEVSIKTYEPATPNRNPMFLEKRVYQGSSGRVYPLPVIDRISTVPQIKSWDALHIENEYLRMMILPEVGGRIHVGYDKTRGYDFFYRQDVMKPALVGLAGPWASGGVEFNWPQHHRPATYMPVETEIEHHEDGSVTVWCSDHDPMLRLKGMHGVCLHPGKAVVDLKVRLFNRTQFQQTFLWWANVATHVHEAYQSFFPTDVRNVADHAKRAITTFPLSDGHYYGVDYGERGRSGVPKDEIPNQFVPDGSYPANDLSWYANIPVPTSYMITGTEGDFSGGYDHHAKSGLVHVANHHIAPGKKQWTWGNHEFGYAWDRSLTDHNGPYIELMAGVYTDNQPDFSYLAPWETKTFTQTWFPIRDIGIPQAANTDSALNLRVDGKRARVGVCVTQPRKAVTVTLFKSGRQSGQLVADIDVAEPCITDFELDVDTTLDELSVKVTADGKTLIEYDPAKVEPMKAPAVAVEPSAPEEMASIEELYLTGVHLDQYRHATRMPEDYWREALRRDPGESRSHNALGLWRLRRGEFDAAAEHFEAAISRITRLNPNPRDGEPYYNLGLVRRYQGKLKQAYDAFYKATWSAAWRSPAYFALAEIDAQRDEWELALDHVQRSLKAEADNLNAQNLLARALSHLNRPEEAETVWSTILSLDPMDIGARWHRGIQPGSNQERIDLALDLLRCGEQVEAIRVLNSADFDSNDGSVPLVLLTLADVQSRLNLPEAQNTYQRARTVSLDYCFPNRLEEMHLLEATLRRYPGDDVASYLLGNFLYDRRRHTEAIAMWEQAAKGDRALATTWRNLGIAYFNHGHEVRKSLDAYDRAFTLDPSDARILYERDQLWKRIGESPARRLEELLRFPALVELRDDLSVELATLYNQTGQPGKALDLLLARHFQPWEGGEGLVLAQYVRAHLLIGQQALKAHDLDAALDHFRATLHIPANLSEARHLLANQNDIYYWMGTALQMRGDQEQAEAWWQRAVRHRGDFQQMTVKNISDMTYWRALVLRQLGKEEDAVSLFEEISSYGQKLEATEAKIDYFATSLPTMLLFDEDLQRRNQIDAWFLRAQALTGLNRRAEAIEILQKLLAEDCNHAAATDLLRQARESQEAEGRHAQ